MEIPAIKLKSATHQAVSLVPMFSEKHLPGLDREVGIEPDDEEGRDDYERLREYAKQSQRCIADSDAYERRRQAANGNSQT